MEELIVALMRKGYRSVLCQVIHQQMLHDQVRATYGPYASPLDNGAPGSPAGSSRKHSLQLLTPDAEEEEDECAGLAAKLPKLECMLSPAEVDIVTIE